jgi:hypothetical protein
VYDAREERARRRQEERKLQEEQQRKVEELQRKLEEQARKEDEEEKRRAIRDTKIAACMEKARKALRSRKYDAALNEIETIYGLDPGNQGAREIEVKVLEAQRTESQLRTIEAQRIEQGEAWQREEAHKQMETNAEREHLRQESGETYRSMLKQAWVDGQPTAEERSMLEVVRLSLGISEDEHALVEREVQVETYTEALQAAWKAGVLTPEDTRTQENLRQLYGMNLEEHLVIEANILKELRTQGK